METAQWSKLQWPLNFFGSDRSDRNDHMEFRKIFIPNRTFLARFGDISGEFSRTMVRILARRSFAKITMVRPNEPDVLSKRTKKGTIR